MKKLFVCLCAGVLLAGCGSGGSKEKTSKVCTLDQNGALLTMNLEGEGETVTKADMVVSASYETMGFESKEAFDALTDDQKKQIEDLLLESANSSGSTEGMDIKTTFDDEGVKITMIYEVGALEKTLNATSMDDMVKEAEKMKMTCK